MIGTRLGPYEITAKLGEGGMGVVYRALDSQLGREVALKVLPEGLTTDPERLARFEREARLLAQLNHPNIAHVYGIESGPVRALVMELVEGPTLAERLLAGPLPLEESLSIARQIAEALEAAHEKGIVHRDLKPQNVKAPIEGNVKVLDFGLARALDPEASMAASSNSPTLMNSPTLTAAGTQLGVILGTAAYMSPEQAKGKPVDKHADIWSFGVVLWEMLTGRRLFDRESVPETLGAVFQQEIDLAALPPSTPSRVRELVRRCLERDPRSRLRDIGEARIALAAPAREDVRPASAAPRSRWPERAAWLAALAALAVLGLLPMPRFGRGAPPTASGPPSFMLSRLTDLPGPERNPDLSPDGRQLLYDRAAGGNRDVYLQRVGGDRAINLTASSAADDSQAVFSADGERIAFRSERDGGGLFVMGATGESVRRVAGGGFDPDWSPDGGRLAYATEAVEDPYSRSVHSRLWTVDVATGEARVLVETTDAVQPAWSPDGRRIAYWSNRDGQRDLWTVDAGSGEAGAGPPVAVTQDPATDWSPEWSPDGRWLYFSSDRGGAMGLWRVAIDPRSSGGALGVPQPVVSGIRSLGHASVSSDGQRLLVMAYDRTSDAALYALDPARPETPRQILFLPRQSLQWCALSPDALWLACSLRGAREDLVLLRADGGELRRLTDDPAKDRAPKWSPDGRTIAFYSTRGGKWDYWAVHPDGSGLRQLTETGEVGSGTWSPDGKQFLVSGPPNELYSIDPARRSDRKAVTPIEITGHEDSVFELSSWLPDGRVVAALVGTAGEAAVVGFLDPARRTFEPLPVRLQGRAFNSVAGWLPSSGGIIVRGADGVVLYDPARGSQRVLLPVEGRDTLDLTRDGRTLLIERDVLDSDLWLVSFAGSGK